MKKLSTLALLLLVGAASAFAQTDATFSFVDKDGNNIPDGTTLTVTETEDDGWGGVMMKTGLFIKTNQTGTVYGSMAYSVLEMTNGAFQVCFPENCTIAESTGDFETPPGVVKVSDIQAEWVPEAYGTATVTLQPKTYRHNSVTGADTFVGYGPKVTVVFKYVDPAGINSAEAASHKVVSTYSLDGRVQPEPVAGINIVKTDDGKTHKVLIKK